MRISVAAALPLLVALSACAPKAVMLPTVTMPRFSDFVEPTVPAELDGSVAANHQHRAWIFLQAGDLRNADKDIAAALKIRPDFFPAEATAGYADLARRDPRAALARFDRALTERARYVPALVGKGQALVALGRESDAIDVLQSALDADRSLTEVQRRLDVLKFRAVQQDIAAARQSARSGKSDDAVRSYRTAIERSPEAGFLYRELAVVERDRGDTQAALENLRKAAALDASDAATLVLLGDVLASREDFDAALKAYGDALAIEPDAGVEAKRNALRTKAEVARLPAEYRAIEAATQITRGDLAALLGVRLAPLLQSMRVRDVGVMTDVRRHWAESWILAVTKAGVLDPYENHTFQPRTVVRRVDLAQAVTRLLSQVAVVAPAQAPRWTNARGRFSDIGPGHLAYRAASTATASGVMAATADGSFQPSRPVTGTEAIAALEAVRMLVPARSDDRRP